MFCNVVTFILEAVSKIKFYCYYTIITIMFSETAKRSQLHIKKKGKKTSCEPLLYCQPNPDGARAHLSSLRLATHQQKIKTELYLQFECCFFFHFSK